MGAPAGMAAAPTTAPADADGWLPLLTHDHRDQRFQPNGERASSPSTDDTGRRTPKMGKLLAAARRVTQSPEPPAPEPPAEHAADATTWLDALGPINPMEAGALAGAFAADYLSWDEAAPRRRGDVLKQYLPSDVLGSASLLGWSGRGRQRAEFALPGAVHPDGEGRVIVDVRVRVTPYRKVGEPADPAPAGELEVAGVPAVAPAPTARGWKSLDSYWVRLTVPITRDQGRLVVDTWDEQLGDEDREPDEDGPAPSGEDSPSAAEEPPRPEAGAADSAHLGKAHLGKADLGKADLETEAAAEASIDEGPAAGDEPANAGATRKPARRQTTRRSTTRPPAGGRGAR
ncbi:hypothetical protein GCM10023321_44530 [Pseudonocardia eucalypti]|uniref:Uncharacterized protein n=1 Tax=Pseudonocardia eucalypti TaxID=648755 RepID=A0ABP9QFI4_9PSEU